MSDKDLIESLRREVYRHFPPRAITQFEELIKRFQTLQLELKQATDPEFYP